MIHDPIPCLVKSATIQVNNEKMASLTISYRGFGSHTPTPFRDWYTNVQLPEVVYYPTSIGPHWRLCKSLKYLLLHGLYFNKMSLRLSGTGVVVQSRIVYFCRLR